MQYHFSGQRNKLVFNQGVSVNVFATNVKYTRVIKIKGIFGAIIFVSEQLFYLFYFFLVFLWSALVKNNIFLIQNISFWSWCIFQTINLKPYTLVFKERCEWTTMLHFCYVLGNEQPKNEKTFYSYRFVHRWSAPPPLQIIARSYFSLTMI